jgi:uncharacterized phage protein (TIGR01671 family)|uniref:YopX protein n=1 Tax=Siphoviridae sp. ctBrh2 TaxID=2827804 RepID=A0A8S5S792_9CAUD|nr:MAG TPA: YopX protein [Siphoviridae sp. ctBrh2]
MVPKFRGKSKLSLNKLYEIGVSYNGDGFVTGNLIQDGKDSYIVNGVVEVNDECMAIEQCVPVFTDTVMQSTGLKDKNGVEVFQGDIVRCTRGCPHEVVWLQEYAGMYIGGMPAWYLSGLSEGYAWTGDEEIIGNIYENPELLEQANES